MDGQVVLLLAGLGKSDQGRMMANARRYLAEFIKRTNGWEDGNGRIRAIRENTQRDTSGR